MWSAGLSFPASPTTLSPAFTVGNNPDRVMWVFLNWARSTTEGASVTYAGVSMTLVANYTFAGGPYGSLWRLVAPATGANNIVVTHSGATFSVFAFSAYNVHQTTPQGTVLSDVTLSGVTSTPTLSPTSTVNDLILRIMNTNTALTSPTGTGTGTTVRQSGNDADADGVAVMADQPGQAGTTVGGMSWTTAATGIYIVVPILSAPSGVSNFRDYVQYDVSLQHRYAA